MSGWGLKRLFSWAMGSSPSKEEEKADGDDGEAEAATAASAVVESAPPGLPAAAPVGKGGKGGNSGAKGSKSGGKDNIAKFGGKIGAKSGVVTQEAVGNGTGYLFSCTTATLKEIETRKLFGAPDWELAQMKKFIKPGSELFLFNLQNWKLLGPFVAAGLPEKSIENGAFGGKFNSHVKVTVWGPLLELNMPVRPKGGAKSASDVKFLKSQLQTGKAAERRVQDAWGAADTGDSQEPAAKRARNDSIMPAISKPAGAMSSGQVMQRIMAPKAQSFSALPATSPVGKGKGKWSPAGPVQPQFPPGGNISPFGKGNSKARPSSSQASTPQGDKGGYVFACNNATQKEIESLHLFGAPDAELPQMQQTITPGTELFLLNLQSWKLMGAFVAVGLPAKSIDPTAFGGKFSAHVRVAPLDAPLLEINLQQRIPSGPKSAAQVNALKMQLKNGSALGRDLQSWGGAPQGMQEASAKRPRQEAPAGRPLSYIEQRAAATQQFMAQSGKGDGKGFAKGDSKGFAPAKGAKNPGYQAAPTLPQNAAGYVFMCNNATLPEIQSLKTFGAPDRELAGMQQIIKPDTPLFLINVQGNTLMGPFVATGAADMKIAPGAFGGKFNAHVSISLDGESSLFEAKLEGRVASGPKSMHEVRSLQKSLRQGKAADREVQEAWGAAVEESSGSTAAAPADTVESSEDGSVLKVPVADKALRALTPEARRDLEADLEKLRVDSGVSIELLCLPSMDDDSLLLRGDAAEVVSIKDWLQSILPFYDVEILDD